MATQQKTAPTSDAAAQPQAQITREQLARFLNEDLAREYQAIIGYVVYSQTLKGAAFMKIAEELEQHAKEELEHALIVARQIDYLGATPTIEVKPVRQSDDAETMLQFDLENEAETIRNYRDRIRQSEAIGEYGVAEELRKVLAQEQDHLIELATALRLEPSEAI